jgi:hypothetical protein
MNTLNSRKKGAAKKKKLKVFNAVVLSFVLIFAATTSYAAVTTGAVTVTSVTDTSAGIGSSSCTGNPSSFGFCYSSTNPLPTTADTCTAGSGAKNNFTGNLSGLTPGTLYYSRAYCVVSGVDNYGAAVTFTTDSAPVATTGSASNIMQTQATLNGSLIDNGANTTVSFEYGTSGWISVNATPNTVLASTTSTTPASTPVSALVTGLTCNTTYNFRVIAANAVGTMTGAAVQFTTSACTPPSAGTGSATVVSKTGATMNGTVNDNLDETMVTFEYGLDASYGSTVSGGTVVAGSGNSAVAAAITGLACQTLYHFRVTAVNISGTTNGNDATFTTVDCVTVPVATTGAASSVGMYGFTLNGTVDDSGGDTTVIFEYGLDASYGSTASGGTVLAGTESASVSSLVAGLACNTLYHFRTIATNSAGTASGSDLTVKTGPCTPTSTTGTANAITRTGATLDGLVSDNGALTTVNFEYGLDPAYGSAAAGGTVAAGAGSTAVAAAITGLSCNTVYHFRVTAQNVSGITNGNDATFSTSACIPTVTTSAISSIRRTSATGGGAVEDAGGAAITQKGVCWSTMIDPTTADSCTDDTASGDPYTSSITGLTLGTTYYARAYAVNSSGTGYGANTFFTTVNTAPTVPAVLSPLASSQTATTTPALLLGASGDIDGDTITYTYEVYSDSGLTSLAASFSTTNTAWTVDVPLMDNTTYYWRALAGDGTVNSLWTGVSDFFVNTANDSPTTPAISTPSDNSRVASLTPVLSITNAFDTDKYDILVYDFDVATSGAFGASIVSSVTGTPQAAGGITSWTTSPALSEDTLYYWRARARDNNGGASGYVSGSFFVSTANSAPSAPTVNAPADAGEAATFTPALVVNNATDSDRDSVNYVFEIDTVNTFDSGTGQNSGVVAEGSGTSAWTPAALSENIIYYWRAKANDGTTDGPWMTTASFFVNTTNEAPGVPTLQNPSDNGEVNTLTPVLSVNAATDADNDIVLYEYQVYSDNGLVTNVTGTSGAGTGWTVDQSLSDNTWYWWRARAVDIHNTYSTDWMPAAAFFVNNNGVNDPPAVTVTAPGASEPPTNSASFTIRWTASDPDSNPVIALYYDTTGSGYSGIQIPTGTFYMTDGNNYVWDVSGLADGAYYIYATIDDGTTINNAYAAGPLVIDRTGPIATISGAPAGPTQLTGATITISGAGVAEYQYRLDGGTWSAVTPYTTSIILSGLADASYALEVKGRDTVGNWQTSVTTATWIVDTIVPDTSITQAPSDTLSNAAFSFMSDPGSTFECKIDGENFQACSSPKTYSDLIRGNHTFEVKAIDTAGNIDPIPASFTWTVTVKDTVPEPLTFTAVADAALNAPVTSTTLSITGINAATPISITGGKYSINGGAFVSTAGTINKGATITVQLTSATTFSTVKSAVVTIGGVKGTFKVTTAALDTVPDAFAFTPQTGVTPETLITSNTITVTGINSAASISISGGTYSINGGAFTSAASTVSSGKTIRVNVLSALDYDSSASATLTIGGVSATFTVTTAALVLSPLQLAADTDTNPAIIWTTGGNAEWFGENVLSYSGGDAAQSGRISHSQSTWIETTVTGPFSVTFFQKVSSQLGYDLLSFSIDGVIKSSISGKIAWQQKKYSVTTGTAETTHTLRWTYSKNAKGSSGMDAGWIDRVVISPITKMEVLTPTGGEIVTSGTTTIISWKATAAAEKFKLYYTLDNGLTWKTINADYVAGTSYDWVVPPVTKAKNCLVKVHGFTILNKSAGLDISNSAFKIMPAP